MERLAAFEKKLTWMIENIMIVLFAIFLAIVCAKVLMRPFDKSIYGVDEMVKISFLCSSALGGAVAISRREHIAITFLIDLMPSPIKKAIYVLGLALIGLMNGALVYLSVDWIAGPGRNIWQPFGMPQSYVFVIVPTACSLAVFYTIVKIVLTIGGLEKTDTLWMPEE